MFELIKRFQGLLADSIDPVHYFTLQWWRSQCLQMFGNSCLTKLINKLIMNIAANLILWQSTDQLINWFQLWSELFWALG